MEAFASNMVVKPFKWAGLGVIILDFKVNNLVAKAVCILGCAGVVLSQYFVQKMKLASTRMLPLMLSLADGVITISRSKFNFANIK